MKRFFILTILICLLSNFLFSNSNNKLNSKFMDSKNTNRELKKYRGMKIAGIILTATGGTCLLSGIGLGVYHQLDPVNSPCSVHLGSTGFGFYRVDFYLNPLVLCLNLTGIALLAIGIPLIAVGAYKEKKTKRGLALFKNVFPEVAINFGNKEVLLGVRIFL